MMIVAVCSVLTLASAGWFAGTSAYLTAHLEILNRLTVGWNDTVTEEEFPTPTPVPPGESVVKKVRIKNTGPVPCYIRASLLVSEGTVTLEGMDTEHWADGKDGYYYYKDVVQPGGSTEELFTAVSVGQAPVGDTVTVTVYEESVQAFHGSGAYKTYKEAWEHYLGGEA